MKSNTEVWVAIRNIGNANDSGEVMNGPLKDCMMWLMTRIGATTMATRIVIGIGRDESSARAAIQTKRNGARLDASEFGDSLDRIFAGESVDDVFLAEGATPVVDSSASTPVSALDTWTPPA